MRQFYLGSLFRQVGLFWGILCGQVQEQVYHHQVDSVSALQAALRLADPLDKVNVAFCGLTYFKQFNLCVVVMLP